MDKLANLSEDRKNDENEHVLQDDLEKFKINL